MYTLVSVIHCTDIPCIWVLQTMAPLQGPCGPDTAAPSAAGDVRAARIFREIWWFTNLKVGLNHEKRVGFERIMGIFFLGTPWIIIKLSTYTWSNLVPGGWQLLFCYKWRNSSCQFCAGYPNYLPAFAVQDSILGTRYGIFLLSCLLNRRAK